LGYWFETKVGNSITFGPVRLDGQAHVSRDGSTDIKSMAVNSNYWTISVHNKKGGKSHNF